MRIKKIDNDPEIRLYLRSMLKAKGRDFSKCEECGITLPEGKAEMHHTKYEGATLNDIKIVCHKCNLKPENRFLK